MSCCLYLGDWRRRRRRRRQCVIHPHCKGKRTLSSSRMKLSHWAPVDWQPGAPAHSAAAAAMLRKRAVLVGSDATPKIQVSPISPAVVHCVSGVSAPILSASCNFQVYSAPDASESLAVLHSRRPVSLCTAGGPAYDSPVTTGSFTRPAAAASQTALENASNVEAMTARHKYVARVRLLGKQWARTPLLRARGSGGVRPALAPRQNT